MSTDHAVVKLELTYLPRGPRGSSQNLLRAAYAALRLNGLGRQAQILGTAAAAYEAALEAVRSVDPLFTPVVVRG